MNIVSRELSPERQAKLETLRSLASAEYSLLQVKSSILPVIASLSATLLVIASFQDRILPLTTGLRWALVVLLILIPLSLFLSLVEIYDGFQAISEERKKALGKDSSNEKKRSPFFDRIFTYAPFIETIILSLVISYMAYQIILHS